MKFLFALALSTLLFSSSMFACSDGGYWIHTPAKYKKPNQEFYVIIHKKRLMLTTNYHGYSDSHLKSILRNYDLFYNGAKCGKATIKKDGFDFYGNDAYGIDRNGCDKLKISERTYAHINTQKGIMKVGQKLSISNEINTSNKKKEIREIIKKTKLWSNKDFGIVGRIQDKDIQNFESFPIKKVSVGKNFSMYIANLHIKNLGKYFGGRGYANYGKEYERVEGVKVEYPVLFFEHGDKISYAGDASACSGWTVFDKYAGVVNRRMHAKNPKYKPSYGRVSPTVRYPKDSEGLNNLGLLEKFKITDAFDLDGDGVVDILVINQKFAFSIGKNGELEVIDFSLKA